MVAPGVAHPQPLNAGERFPLDGAQPVEQPLREPRVERRPHRPGEHEPGAKVGGDVTPGRVVDGEPAGGARELSACQQEQPERVALHHLAHLGRGQAQELAGRGELHGERGRQEAIERCRQLRAQHQQQPIGEIAPVTRRIGGPEIDR